jgi:AcrR family transcriptional regulator
VREAGVSRGALYHQFGEKADLFAAVFEALEVEVIGQIGARVLDAPALDPIERMQLAASCWLDACEDPAVLRIALIDAPAVLGWTRWREIGDRYGLALAQRLIVDAISAGRIQVQPVQPLAYVLLGALRESALYIAAAGSKRARAEIGAVVARFIGSLSSS